MILNCQEMDPDFIRHFRVEDAETGADLGARLPIFYADDVAGVIRYGRHDPSNPLWPHLRLIPGTYRPDLAQERRPIRIVEKAAAELAAEDAAG